MIGENVFSSKTAGGDRSCVASFASYLFSTLLLIGSALLLLAPTHALALDEVTPAEINIIPGHETLALHAPYSEDSDNNCTLIVAWAQSGTDWTDQSVETVVLDHQVSTFTYQIEGLQNFTTYQVKVTFIDDLVTNNGLQEQIVASVVPYNRLLHNSYTTGSLKWNEENGWGVPNSKYGEFSCSTCHAKQTGNIKRIKTDIEVTDSESTDSFPIEGHGSVSFLSTQKGESDFGNDKRVPDNESTNICESCHTSNKFHNYNASANNTGGFDHYNRDDCIGCHTHNQGFKASCGGCHPEEPAVASHDEHFNSAILTLDFACRTCHETSIHRNSLSEIRFDASNPIVSSATYSEEGGDEASCYDEETDYCDTPVYGTCNNLYCHSNADPLAGTNAYSQPTWGGAGMQCDSCHDPAGGSQAMSAPHGRHIDPAAYAYACEKCHADTVSGSDTISNPALHINLTKDVTLNVTGVYNATTNECSNIYCHTDGRAGADTSPSCDANEEFSCHYADLNDDGIEESLGNQTTSIPRIPDWSDVDSYDCSSCHKGRPGNKDCFEEDDCPGSEEKYTQMDSNGHFRLANDHWIRKYECYECHYQTTDEFSELKFDSGTHVNEKVDVSFGPKSNILGYPPPSYNDVEMTCLNIYCHSDGTKVPQVRDFPWDSGKARCDSCHGHEQDDNCSAASCHPDTVPVVTPENQWKMATPMYENTGPGTDRANSHMRHLETEFACENCHRETVVGSCNTVGCHDGEIPDGLMSEVGHIIPEFHVNTEKDVIFKDGGDYDRLNKTCSDTACHGHPDPLPKWGDSRNGEILCLTCHGDQVTDVDDYGAFNGIRAKINMVEWKTSGHGRMASEGNYPSGNPPADFPGNPCWYCHDNEVLHDNVTNPYRLKEHPQFEKRFEKECVYCHMEQKDEECWKCHDDPNSLSTDFQLSNLTDINHDGYAGNNQTCLTSDCHLPQAASECSTCHENPAHPSGAVQLDDSLVRTRPGGKTYVISEIRVGMTESPYSVDHIEFSSTGSKSNVSCMSTSQEWPPTGCHTADAHIHNTGAGIWTDDQTDDVKNQYVMMGVCLQCHDNDDSDRCNSCHTWPEDDEENNPYRLGYDPGTGFHSGSSKASSTHFGFKHFEGYEESLSVVDYTGTTSTASKEDQKHVVTHLTDGSKSWVDDELVGKSFQLTSGPLNGEIRPILVNSYNSVTVKGYYPESVADESTYKILGTVWKGGKFCWDCHDPHGDTNIYMIQDEISVTTDGLFGKPLERAAVSFTRTISGRDYAKDSFPFNGICNVCHTNVDHYRKDDGDTHRSGRRCTTCHNHGFAEGHGSGGGCADCHEQKPVPNHLGFGQPRDCTKCHDGVINKRTDIMRQFRGQSHHVQGIDVTNEHCYKCHWEATEFGLINNDYHIGYNYKTHETVSKGQNDMVIWDASGRPDRHELGVTAITFNTSSIGTSEERENVEDVTLHCLGCHSKQHNDTDVFGDCKTPRQYAWDRTSIAERYLDEGTTNWGKYTGIANAAKKIQTKAFSAHGNAVENKRGWDTATGEDGTLPNGDQGGVNVQCYDCHNSHGSYTSGITSSYQTFDNTYRGANLKETQAGKGGYDVTYQAVAVKDEGGAVNPMNPGAAQCFDCHETYARGAKPWGYNSTFGAQLPIQSYRDSLSFAGGRTGHKDRFGYRSGMNSLGGHLKASENLTVDALYPINGLCSGCHDPHGVSPSLGDGKAYAVPLLKGTWLTSPYKDDVAQPLASTYYTRNKTRLVEIDRSTFGNNNTGVTEDAETFGGLCLRCHPKEHLTDEYVSPTEKPVWQSVERVHQTVKGWGSNTEHSFPCAKCHNAHSSGLGRLMRTNCLDVQHKGQIESGGVPYQYFYSANDYGQYPRMYRFYENNPTACHDSAGAKGGAWDEQEWNEVTPWPVTP